MKTAEGEGMSELAELERPDAAAKKALLAATVGYAMDGFDLLILGFMLPAIAADLALTPAQAGSLVTWTLAGAVVGGIGFGILADNLGRVRVLTWTILLFAVFTGLCATASGYDELRVYRTLAGVGLGASSASAWRWWPKPGRRGCGRAPVPTWRSAGRRACCWRHC